MSRYIDADDAANAIYHHFPSIRTMADARGIIEEAPSIDIVFCEERKYEKRCTTNVHFLADNGLDVIPVRFCSYGERRVSDD